MSPSRDTSAVRVRLAAHYRADESAWKSMLPEARDVVIHALSHPDYGVKAINVRGGGSSAGSLVVEVVLLANSLDRVDTAVGWVGDAITAALRYRFHPSSTGSPVRKGGEECGRIFH